VLLLIVGSATAIFSQAGEKIASRPAPTDNCQLIAIDPGHPSETSGGCVHHGLKEVDICWQVALQLEKLVAAEPGLRSIKTKPQVDRLVTNRERAEIANAAGAALMLRLHCDSGKGSGCTLYYPDREGTVQGVTGPSEEVITQSRLAAEAMQKGLAGVLGSQLKLNPIKTDSVTYVGSKQGALTGSIFAKVPALVVEMVYLNNASDAAFIKEPAGQELLARGMLAGIKEFVSVNR
jgi:N-acetylmuramoyl-L-alanine amidase